MIEIALGSLYEYEYEYMYDRNKMQPGERGEHGGCSWDLYFGGDTRMNSVPVFVVLATSRTFARIALKALTPLEFFQNGRHQLAVFYQSESLPELWQRRISETISLAQEQDTQNGAIKKAAMERLRIRKGK